MTELNDLKARAEAVGYTLEIEKCQRGYNCFLGSYPPDEFGSTREGWLLLFHPEKEAEMQAAVDLIAAEEKRQECPKCKGKGVWKEIGEGLGRRGYPLPKLIMHDPCPDCRGTGKRPKEAVDGKQ